MLSARMPKIFPVLAVVFLCCTLAGAGGAAEPEDNSRDTLVYKDGDRVLGRLIEKTDKIIVFASDRFGNLRVLVTDAVVIKAEAQVGFGAGPKAPLAAEAGKAKEKAAQNAEAERLSLLERFRLSVLTADLRDFFGPWHGRLAFSLEQVSNTAEQDNTGVEATLQRKWKSDELQLKGRYDYSATNGLTTTDLMKAEGLWRHDFPRNYFTLYHPTLEWNRASFTTTVPSVPNNYVQLQQEIGVGVSLLSTARRKVRVGVSENLFDVWNTEPGGIHTNRTVESFFEEMELKLPWRMSLSQRGVYYYSFVSGKDGWEDRIELSKKFTETLSTSIRHEVRRYNPDGTTQDYTRLKLLFGLDF
jgi:hypothetical protein